MHRLSGIPGQRANAAIGDETDVNGLFPFVLLIFVHAEEHDDAKHCRRARNDRDVSLRSKNDFHLIVLLIRDEESARGDRFARGRTR